MHVSTMNDSDQHRNSGSLPDGGPSLFLFVPGDRPERFAKALSASADAVIIDLEDAVAPAARNAARAGLQAATAGLANASDRVFLRVNAVGTAWHDDDIDAFIRLPIAGIVLPKAESAEHVSGLRRRTGRTTIIAIVESARGLAMVDEIAAAADQIAFGSMDFAADMGCAHSREALLLARSRIVLAARLANKAPPIDGVTQAIHDGAEMEEDARYGASLGFSGKLLIHPAQVQPARRGLAPSDQDVAWAKRIVAASADGAAIAVDGAMVDAPVLARAYHIIRASGAAQAIGRLADRP